MLIERPRRFRQELRLNHTQRMLLTEARDNFLRRKCEHDHSSLFNFYVKICTINGLIGRKPMHITGYAENDTNGTDIIHFTGFTSC